MIVNIKTPQTDFFERTDTLMRYYEEIRRFTLLSPDQEIALFKVYQTGNTEERKKAKDKIINCNQRFVVGIAKRFATNNNVLDLINEGNLGLIEAIESFDLSKKVKFTTWAVWYIRRAINLYCINTNLIVKKNNLSKTYHVVSAATNKFMQKEFRAPTSDELINILKADYDVDIREITDVLDTKITSIDESYNVTDNDDISLGDEALFNSYSATTNTYETVASNDFNKTIVESLLNKLTSREQTIMKMSFGVGYDREYELCEIASKLGLTTERIRQTKNEVLLRLAQEYKEQFNKL